MVGKRRYICLTVIDHGTAQAIPRGPRLRLMAKDYSPRTGDSLARFVRVSRGETVNLSRAFVIAQALG